MEKKSEVYEQINDIRENLLIDGEEFYSDDVRALIGMVDLLVSMIPRSGNNMVVIQKNQEKLKASVKDVLRGLTFPETFSEDYCWLAINLAARNPKSAQLDKALNLLMEIVRNDIRLGNAP